MGAVAAVSTAHMRCASLVTPERAWMRGATPGEDHRVKSEKPCMPFGLRACPAPLLKPSVDA